MVVYKILFTRLHKMMKISINDFTLIKQKKYKIMINNYENIYRVKKMTNTQIIKRKMGYYPSISKEKKILVMIIRLS